MKTTGTLKASVLPGAKSATIAIPMKRRDLPKNDNVTPQELCAINGHLLSGPQRCSRCGRLSAEQLTYDLRYPAFLRPVHGGLTIIRKVSHGVFEAMHPDGVWRRITKL